MFEGFKYRLGKNHVLFSLERDGKITKSQRKLMMDISYNVMNRTYGIGLLKSGAAMDKFSAAAAVFARLSVTAQNSPQGPEIDAVMWETAAYEAMIQAGAGHGEAAEIVQGLKQMNRETMDAPLF